MENKICFLFGHGTISEDVTSQIEMTAQRYHIYYGIDTFIVGGRGDFDRYASSAIKSLKRRYDDICLLYLLSYHPAERPVELSDGFDGSFYPPLEGVPRRYAIVRANRYMVAHADGIICYVNHIGNSRDLLELARQRQRRDGIPIENLGTYCSDGIKM